MSEFTLQESWAQWQETERMIAKAQQDGGSYAAAMVESGRAMQRTILQQACVPDEFTLEWLASAPDPRLATVPHLRIIQ